MKNYQERRKHKRIPRVISVDFSPNSDLKIHCSCDSIDISENGIRLLLSRQPLEGKDAEISFKLHASEDDLTIVSHVIWSRPSSKAKGMFESGVEFRSLSDINKKLLRRYIPVI